MRIRIDLLSQSKIYMSDEVENSLIFLLEKSPKKGRCATLEEVANINQHFPGIIPDWYEKLLVNYPICEFEIGWQSFEPEDDFDGIEWIEWSNPIFMLSETFESYPGIEIYKHGYLNVATCLTGSGDNYFININEGENPRILQIYHDISDKAEIIIKEGIDIVANSLSEFFRNAIIPR